MTVLQGGNNSEKICFFFVTSAAQTAGRESVPLTYLRRNNHPISNAAFHLYPAPAAFPQHDAP